MDLRPDSSRWPTQIRRVLFPIRSLAQVRLGDVVAIGLADSRLEAAKQLAAVDAIAVEA